MFFKRFLLYITTILYDQDSHEAASVGIQQKTVYCTETKETLFHSKYLNFFQIWTNAPSHQ